MKNDFGCKAQTRKLFANNLAFSLNRINQKMTSLENRSDEADYLLH